MKTILLDSGHGGIIKGIYQTAPAKMHTHQDGSIAYEGDLNRKVKAKIMELMDIMGLPYIDICPTNLDIPLSARCEVINSYCKIYNNNCLLISLHSNAGGGRGFEIWTTPGQNKSDEYATEFVKIFKEQFPAITVRIDQSDKDPDKESQFYILKNSMCPAILPEWLFFDNYQDWLYQRHVGNQISYARMITEFIQEII